MSIWFRFVQNPSLPDCFLTDLKLTMAIFYPPPLALTLMVVKYQWKNLGILESVVKDFIDNMFACVTEYTCMDILFVFNVQIFIIC